MVSLCLNMIVKNESNIIKTVFIGLNRYIIYFDLSNTMFSFSNNSLRTSATLISSFAFKLVSNVLPLLIQSISTSLNC